jgi:hypothetical protein
MILKPRCGGGGVFNRVVDSEDSFERAAEEIAGRNPNLSKKNIILQEFVPGIPASVSVISTGKEAISIAVNEQLIGIPWLTRMPFAYCGNITPFETQYKDEMMNIAEQLCKHFGLIGSNGIDFLITEKGVVVLEINARFQGSLDSVELATGFNLFEAHRNAFAGILPQKPSADKYAARTVVYAYGNPLHINKKLTSFRVSGKFADIQKAGHISMSDEPILSIMEEGQSRQEILDKLYLTCQALRNTMSEV